MAPSEITDPTDPRLGHGRDETPVPQNEVYLVLSAEERAKGFVRPVRRSYLHITCPTLSDEHLGALDVHGNPLGALTTMSVALAETYARDPHFYGATYCCACSRHRPLDEFVWDGTNEKVGS